MSDERPANEPLTVDYWRLTRALGRALDHESPEFWRVAETLGDEFPEFSWHNAMTDGGPAVPREADYPTLDPAEERAILATPGVTEALDAALAADPEALIDRGSFAERVSGDSA